MKLRRLDDNGVYWFGIPCQNDETLNCYNELETFIEIGFSGGIHEELSKGNYLSNDDEHGTFFLNAFKNGECIHHELKTLSVFANSLLFDCRSPNPDFHPNGKMFLTDGKRTSQKNVTYFPNVGKLVLSFNSPEHPLQGFEIILQVNDQIKVQNADKTRLTLKPTIDKKVEDSFSIHFFNEETNKGKLYKLPFGEFLQQFNFIETPNCQTDELLFMFDYTKHEVQEHQTENGTDKIEYLNFDLVITYRGKQYKIKSNDLFWSITHRSTGHGNFNKINVTFCSFEK